MPLYRAVIAPEGPLASPLHSDTLFGAFCWSWLRRYGRESLEGEIITPSLDGKPPVIFSNGFPHDVLPLPLGCYDGDNDFSRIADKQERRTAYQRSKKLKGVRYVSRTAFDRIRTGDWQGFTSELRGEIGTDATTIHNMVSRDSGTVENLDGAGSLYTSDRRFFAPGDRFDIYLLSPLPVGQLSEVLSLTLSLGIGADKSTGCGVFQLESLEEDRELAAPPDGADGFVNLSNWLPAREDPTEGQYQLLPKYPKLDRELAGEEYPFKKPMLFLSAGAFFRAKRPRAWYGRCITNVAAVERPVIVNGCTIAVSARWPQEL